MSEGLKTAVISAVVALVVVLTMGSMGVNEESLGGTKVFKGDVVFADSITVDEDLTAGPATIVGGSSSSTLSIGTSADGSSVGFSCYWNGSEYTMTFFAGSTTTPSYATSTTCVAP